MELIEECEADAGTNSATVNDKGVSAPLLGAGEVLRGYIV